ncbi:MAG: hypothetical protein ACI4YB_08055 [Oscillospiraceae bacterium]
MKKRLLSLFAAFAISAVLSACQADDTELNTASEVTEPTVETSETVISSETAQTSFLTEDSTQTNETVVETSSTETVETITIAGCKYDVNQESIFLYGSDIANNEDIQQLAHFNNLKKLSIDLYPKKPDIIDLSPLSELKTVESLHINGTYTDLSFIEGMTNLNSLVLEHFFCETLENVPQNTTITSFSFSDTRISDISWIANFSELNKLNLTHFDCDDYSHIGKASKLKTLFMFMIESENTDMKFLEDLKLLEYFDFSPGYSTCNFDAVSNCTNLEYLCVYAGIENLEFCNSLNKLRKFSFYSADDREYSLLPLLSCDKLEELSLFCNFSDRELAEVEKSLTECKITVPKNAAE